MNGVRVKSWPAKVVDTLEPARSCVVSCARSATCNARPKRGKAEAHFCNWATLGSWLNYTTGCTFMLWPDCCLLPPLSRGKLPCAPRTSEIGRASLSGFRVNCSACALDGEMLLVEDDLVWIDLDIFPNIFI